MISNVEIVIRLVLSAVIGGLIGMEREVSNRPAGLRTHVLVSLGSALIMLVSIDAFFFEGVRVGDPARLAAQVVSGIGFLGAGTIMRTGDRIRGLTTAASLWVSAGIGLSIGSGYYLGAIISATIVLATLMSLGVFEKRIAKKKYKSVEITAFNRPGVIGQIGVLFGKYHVSIKDISMVESDSNEEEDGILEMHFLVKSPNSFDILDFYREIYEVKGIISLVFEGKTILDFNNKSKIF